MNHDTYMQPVADIDVPCAGPIKSLKPHPSSQMPAPPAKSGNAKAAHRGQRILGSWGQLSTVYSLYSTLQSLKAP